MKTVVEQLREFDIKRLCAEAKRQIAREIKSFPKRIEAGEWPVATWVFAHFGEPRVHGGWISAKVQPLFENGFEGVSVSAAINLGKHETEEDAIAALIADLWANNRATVPRSEDRTCKTR